MNRRIAIRNMALILGSVAVLPSCLNDKKGKPVVELKTLKIDADQENLVSNLAETILPKTSTPGANELGINLFIFKMLDDCTNKEQQENFMGGLKDFDDAVNKKYSKSFNECTVTERTAFVTALEKQTKDEQAAMAKNAVDKKDKPKDAPKLNSFYQMVKGQTIFGYTTSQYFMTKQIVYELVPGRYNAMFPVKKTAAV
ncbi:gluconate 2-dehydrogenase subunit 3 family protein [Mucilaginibacter glaciei]|uniref:Gluconate 2-dehydrogenase subunit 3 family protein n=1 Tax=Mucilaginibacter glaciei TaxID=2772109 RepID=A0A926S091_9SPHI|nr:gluconate 2-dehydrogenase subunit 3 family protein [Mucilaginibacter glaciei]MBD1391482.1 gluconate 2-dehydrogenase subunit 3 family protein [Mucilaginibacter glaciei]